MQIDRLILGAFETNCYILRQSDDTADCVIIDTGLEDDGLVEFLQQHQFNPVALVLTHGHADHIGGVNALRESFPAIKIYIHKLDAPMLTGGLDNLSELAGMTITASPADVLLEEGDEVELAGIKLKVLHTPGHTPGGISLYLPEEATVFVGDTLFADSVGRTDFPGASGPTLIASIREKLFELPEDTKVLPGHGPATQIAHEKKYNPFLQ